MRPPETLTIPRKDQSRLIGKVSGAKPGPTVVFFGGIHGNEPAGVVALQRVMDQLNDKDPQEITGTVIALKGNRPALEVKKRFLSEDLNRMWTEPSIRQITEKTKDALSSEETELLHLGAEVEQILQEQNPPFYFIDLHTTSSETKPFITVNDALINRKFARLFHVPTILGIEEFLEGPLLSYLNERGYVCMGFESGSHESQESVHNNISLIWLSLWHCGSLLTLDADSRKTYTEQLKQSSKGDHHFYEITHREVITSEDDFNMLPGFKNFQHVKKGKPLARNNHKEIHATQSTLIFMPLYQEQGEEGFFYIRRIPGWVLRLSARIRFWNWHRWITILPGVRWAGKEKEKILVDLRIARFFTRSFFHVLGYRNRYIEQDYMVITNRELKAKTEMYEDTSWFKN